MRSEPVYAEVRCCCRPEELLGWLQVDHMPRPGFGLRLLASDRGTVLLDEPPARTVVETLWLEAREMEQGDRVWTALRARHGDLDVLSRVPAFVRKTTMHEVLNMRELAAETGERMLRWFAYKHLPPDLQEMSEIYAVAALAVVRKAAPGEERTVSLRKLLEAKDAGVRAYKEGLEAAPRLNGAASEQAGVLAYSV